MSRPSLRSGIGPARARTVHAVKPPSDGEGETEFRAVTVRATVPPKKNYCDTTLPLSAPITPNLVPKVSKSGEFAAQIIFPWQSCIIPQPTSDALPLAALAATAAGAHHTPRAVLGPHPSAHGITIRLLRPLAGRVDIVTATHRYSARHEHNGIWAVTIPGENIPDYRIEATYDDDSGSSTVDRTDDPYRFLPSIGELDLHLIGEGRHAQLWQVLGAHTRTYPSELGAVYGVAFTVWAPNAQAVQVIGDFNHWTGVAHSMRSLGSSGIWELFIPDVEVGTRYKFKIHGPDGA